MARVSPAQAVDKWSRRTKAAVPDYVAGIQGVQQAPGAAAARQQNAYLEGVQNKVGKWAANVAGVSLQDWQQAAATTGSQRISGGVDKAQNKMAASMAKLLPYVDSVVAQVKAMPKGSLEQNIQRSVAFQTKMAQFKK